MFLVDPAAPVRPDRLESRQPRGPTDRASRHDSMVFDALVDAIPAIPDLPVRPRQLPHKLHTDKGYDSRRSREHLQRRGILIRISRWGIVSSEKLGRHR